MRLKNEKCKTISTDLRNNLSFEDGTVLENVDQEKYLGGILHRRSNQAVEINSRLKDAPIAVKKDGAVMERSKVQWKIED